MAQKRSLLHIDKLDAFKAWCVANAIPTRAGKGDYQVLQVKTPHDGWQVIFSRGGAFEHYSINEKLIPTVKRFINEGKR
jgi:hypothetical protein